MENGNKESTRKQEKDDQVEFFEENDDMGVFDEEVSEETMGGKTKRFLGLDGREKYDSTYEYVKEHVAKNGPLGAINGFIVAAASVLAHVAQVVWKNIIGEPAHFDLKEAMNRAKEQSARELNQEAKQVRKEEKEKQAGVKEQKYGKKGQTTEQEAAKREQEADFETNVPVEEIENMSENLQQYYEYKRAYIGDIETQNKIIEGVLQCKNMQDFQENFQIIMKNDPNSDRVYIFQKDKENNLTKLPYITKQNLIEGNSNPISEFFYNEEAKEYGLEASAKAVLLGSKIKNEMFSCVYADIREEVNENRENRVMLATSIVETENHSVGALETFLSSAKESVDLYYKNQFIGTVDLTEPFESNIEGICKGMKEIDKKMEKEECKIGNGVSFSKINSETVKIKANGEESEFLLRNQEDLKSISDFIAWACPGKSEKECQIESLIIGGKMHPYMEKIVDEGGRQLNPFTNDVIKDGELILTQKDGFPVISEYQINMANIESGTNRISGYAERYVTLALIPLNGEETELEQIKKDTLSRVGKEKNRNFIGNEREMTVDNINKYQNAYQVTHTGDAREFFKSIQKENVLGGGELNGIMVVGFDKEFDDSEEEYENDGNRFDDMLREAEEEMKKQEKHLGEEQEL